MITSSPLGDHPSIDCIQETIESLSHIKDLTNEQIIIAQDGLRYEDKNKKYEGYLKNLEKYIKENNMNAKINLKESWGGLTGNIRDAIKLVKTKYLLVIQHDFPFVSDFEVYKMIEDMEENSQLKHVRFNKRSNGAYMWDNNKLFRKELICKNYIYTRTGIWSDMNHLTTLKYYQEIVLKESEDEDFMESSLKDKPLEDHKKYGTYIFGPVNYPKTILHIKGRAR